MIHRNGHHTSRIDPKYTMREADHITVCAVTEANWRCLAPKEMMYHVYSKPSSCGRVYDGFCICRLSRAMSSLWPKTERHKPVFSWSVPPQVAASVGECRRRAQSVREVRGAGANAAMSPDPCQPHAFSETNNEAIQAAKIESR